MPGIGIGLGRTLRPRFASGFLPETAAYIAKVEALGAVVEDYQAEAINTFYGRLTKESWGTHVKDMVLLGLGNAASMGQSLINLDWTHTWDGSPPTPNNGYARFDNTEARLNTTANYTTLGAIGITSVNQVGSFVGVNPGSPRGDAAMSWTRARVDATNKAGLRQGTGEMYAEFGSVGAIGPSEDWTGIWHGGRRNGTTIFLDRIEDGAPAQEASVTSSGGLPTSAQPDYFYDFVEGDVTTIGWTTGFITQAESFAFLSAVRDLTQGICAPLWFTLSPVSDLLMAYDFRGVTGASDIFLDVNSKLWIASDLSGKGNDYEAISAGSSVNPYVNAAVDGGGVRLSQPENNKLYSTTRAARGMSPTEDDHTFVVLKMLNAKPVDDTTKGLSLINISGNGGNSPKVIFSDAGGAAVFGSYDAYEYWTQNGNVLKGGNVNLSSLTGRAETDAADRYALVEVRRDEVDSLAQIWVNGFLVAEDTTVSSNTPASYDYIGMATLGYEANIYAWATGDILTTGFTLEQAEGVRAALMADYGIPVWDGATYPA